MELTKAIEIFEQKADTYDKKAKELAEFNKDRPSDFCDKYFQAENNCIENAREYHELANWLKDYKRLKNQEEAAQNNMTASHSERDIFDGCISLMQRLVKDFRDYLEFIDVDVNDMDEDEKFGIAYPVTEIVRTLFLAQTSHSGGTSSRMKLEELGVENNYIKFGFTEDTKE